MGGRQIQEPPTGGIEHLDLPAGVDDDEPGGEAVGDLAPQVVRCVGPCARRLLLRLEPRDGILQRRRQDGGIGTVLAQVAGCVARTGDDAEDRERQHADEHRNRRRQPDERVAVLRHQASPAQVRYARSAWS